jgi:outer membrane protein TolC
MLAPALTLTGLLLSGLTAAAPAVQGITLEEALELAEQHDRRFITLSLSKQAALWNAAAAAAQMLPSLSAQAGITRNAREIKIGSGADERVVSPLYVPQASAQARFALINGPDLPAAFAAWKRWDATALEAGEQRDGLRHDVAALYLLAAELEQIGRAQAVAAEQAEGLLTIARARVAAGEGLPLDVADAEAELLRITAEQATTEGEREAALLLLRLRLGLAEETPLVVGCNACVLLPADERDLVFMPRRRGDLLGLDQRAWAARADELAGWASLLPTVEVVANARLQQPTLFSPDPIWWTAQLVFRWDIIGPSPRGSGLLKSVALDRNAAAATEVHAIALAEAEVAVKAARARLAASEQGFSASQARARAAGDALRQAQARFEVGRFDAADVLDVARRKADADRDLARADFARLRARLAVRRALGMGPIDEGERHD